MLWAGALRFSRFPSLAGDEGESQWQSPDPAPNLNPSQENWPMPHPSKDLRETESALRSIIQTLIDGQENFRNIGEQVQDEKLKEYFFAESLTRALFRGVLESILHQEGVHDVKENGTAAATVERMWGDLKFTLGGGAHALLTAAVGAEDEALESYSKALDASLPLPVRQVLDSQSAHIESSRDFIQSVHDANK
jgi:uncharacterized protein (TIGR02284 family)